MKDIPTIIFGLTCFAIFILYGTKLVTEIQQIRAETPEQIYVYDTIQIQDESLIESAYSEGFAEGQIIGIKMAMESYKSVKTNRKKKHKKKKHNVIDTKKTKYIFNLAMTMLVISLFIGLFQKVHTPMYDNMVVIFFLSLVIAAFTGFLSIIF